MNKRISLGDKKPEVKSQNPVSQIRRKAESTQSMSSPVDRILFLQKTIGNQAVARLIKSGSLQTKLKIGQSGDIYEQEADRVAEQVMRMPDISKARDSRIQRKCPKCLKGLTGLLGKDKKDEKLQAKETPDKTPEVTPHIEANINALKGGGQPLPESTRAFFEPRFGHDFSKVRVHTDAKAVDSAREVNALAFTVGQDVVFGEGQYAPGTGEGQKLMAHELTHVLQQRGSTVQQCIQFMPKTKWKYTYRNKNEADAQVKRLKNLGLDVDQPIKGKNGQWGFEFIPLSEEEAKTLKEEKEKKFGKTSTFIVKRDNVSGSYYVKETKKCPEAIPIKKGFLIWDECFDKKMNADQLVKKFAAKHVTAEVFQLSTDQFGVYYQPLTEAEAKKVGEEAAKKKPDYAEGMYQVNVKEVIALKTFTYEIEVKCPKGWTDLGNFHITGYAFAIEKDFPDKPVVKDPCGLKGPFREQFLTKTRNGCPFGVKMEGSGKAIDGSIIHYEGRKDGKECFSKVTCPLTSSGSCATVGTTAAVGPDIKEGTELLIEGIGKRTAQDVGGGIKKGEIDIWFGEDWKSACRINYRGKVCKK